LLLAVHRPGSRPGSCRPPCLSQHRLSSCILPVYWRVLLVSLLFFCCRLTSKPLLHAAIQHLAEKEIPVLLPSNTRPMLGCLQPGWPWAPSVLSWKRACQTQQLVMPLGTFLLVPAACWLPIANVGASMHHVSVVDHSSCVQLRSQSCPLARRSLAAWQLLVTSL